MRAAWAEEEGEQISLRTKAALQAAKARGVQLGKHSAILSKQNKEHADRWARDIARYVTPLRQTHKSIRKLTDAMNAIEVPTQREGSKWHPTSVRRLLTRLDQLDA